MGPGRPKPAHLLLLSDWLAAVSKVGTVQSWRAQCKVMSPSPSSADPRGFRDGPDEPASQQSWRMEVVGSHQKPLHPNMCVLQLFRKSLRRLGLTSSSTQQSKELHGAAVSTRRYSAQWLAGSGPSTRSTITQLRKETGTLPSDSKRLRGAFGVTSVVQVWIQTGAADPGHEITPQPVGTGLLAPGGSFLSGSDTRLVELYQAS